LMDINFFIFVAWSCFAKNPRPFGKRAGFVIFNPPPPRLSLHPLRVMEAELLQAHNFALGLWL